MFIRVKKYKTWRQSVQIVENQRIWWKTKQKVIKHVGSASDERCINWLIKNANYILYELKNKGQTYLFPIEYENIKEYNKEKEKDLNVNLKNITEEKRVIKWIHDIYWKLYHEIWFDKIISNPTRNKKIVQCLKQITLARIAMPKSKRASVELLDRDYWISLNLNSVYNMMWKIWEKEIKKIQEISYKYTKDVFKEKIDILFLDWTTLYFESEKEDELRKPWYWKEWKPQDVKVLLVLFVTKSWLPVWYKLFEWNKYEWHTLQPMIESIKKQYNIDNIFFAADSWFLNKENIKYLEEQKYKYVLWARIKNLSNKMKNEITNKENYKILERNKDGTIKTMYKELNYKWKRLIITYKPKLAEKDKKQREKHIETLMEKTWNNATHLIWNFWYKKYIKNIWEKIEIDEEKIQEAEKWDGLKWVITNDKDESVWEILWHYWWLWQIEESFRINKHDLLIRPIFHRTEKKIRAHIAIAYIAFTLVRHLEYRMKLIWTKISPERIRTELLHIQWSILYNKSTQKRYFLPSRISWIWESIYKAVNSKWKQSVFKI